MGTPVKVGVIGVGVGRGHIREYMDCPDAELVAICDADAVRMAEVVDRMGLKGVTTYADYHEMLKHKGLEAVSIALPNFLHAPIAIAALESGKHVLCEKPLALNAREAASMVSLARSRGLALMVNFNYRFSEASWAVHQAIQAGLIGDVYYAKSSWLRNRGVPGIGGWFTTKKLSGGGALIDLGVHRLDLALWFMGYPQPVGVSGAVFGQFGRQFAEAQGKSFDVDDLAAGFIRFANGAVLAIEASWAGNSEKREEMSTQVFGSIGGAIQRNTGEGYDFESRVFYDVNGTLTEVRPLTRLFGLEPIRHHFVHSIQQGVDPIAPGEHGLIIMQIIDALYESAKLGREVTIMPLS
ncbi:MAG: Gfo/Idh/MocA family oxidoreductase [Chloroflexi bacterium]|nr:Gfo/Idh/MocA family oxidoreductase [Chloroflexota bacterium]